MIFIIQLLTLIFTEYIYLLCFSKMYSEKVQIKKYHILVLVFLAIVLYANNFFNNVVFKISLSLFILISINKIFFKKELKKTIITSCLLCIISLTVELVLTFLMSALFANFQELNDNPVPKTCLSLLLTCTTYYIINIKKFLAFLKRAITLKLEYSLFIIIFILNFLVIRYNLDYKNYYNFISNMVIISGLLLLLVITLSAIHKRTIYKLKSENLAEKVEYYEQIAADYSELKHNLNDDFLAIRSVANKETKDIVDEKIKKYNKNYGWISSLDNVPKGLQGLIYMKLSDIKEYEICVEVENKVDEKIISKLPSKTYSELCDALGITINNAIEATSNCSEKVIYINLEEDKEFLRLKIINTFSGYLDLDEIGNRNYSTKKVKSGIGLDYLKKLKTIKIKKEIMNNLFIISILVPIN